MSWLSREINNIILSVVSSSFLSFAHVTRDGHKGDL